MFVELICWNVGALPDSNMMSGWVGTNIHGQPSLQTFKQIDSIPYIFSQSVHLYIHISWLVGVLRRSEYLFPCKTEFDKHFAKQSLS